MSSRYLALAEKRIPYDSEFIVDEKLPEYCLKYIHSDLEGSFSTSFNSLYQDNFTLTKKLKPTKHTLRTVLGEVNN